MLLNTFAAVTLGFVFLLILMALALIGAGWIIYKIYILLYKIQPTISVTATPSNLNDSSRVTVVKVKISLSATLKKPVNIKGRIWEADAFGDDHLQTFTVRIPANTNTSQTTFTLNAVNTGNEEILNGNRGYSGAEDEWEIYAETEENGRIEDGSSSYTSIFWN